VQCKLTNNIQNTQYGIVPDASAHWCVLPADDKFCQSRNAPRLHVEHACAPCAIPARRRRIVPCPSTHWPIEIAPATVAARARRPATRRRRRRRVAHRSLTACQGSSARRSFADEFGWLVGNVQWPVGIFLAEIEHYQAHTTHCNVDHQYAEHSGSQSLPCQNHHWPRARAQPTCVRRHIVNPLARPCGKISEPPRGLFATKNNFLRPSMHQPRFYAVLARSWPMLPSPCRGAGAKGHSRNMPNPRSATVPNVGGVCTRQPLGHNALVRNTHAPLVPGQILCYDEPMGARLSRPTPLDIDTIPCAGRPVPQFVQLSRNGAARAMRWWWAG
jgi:hypothetical protein